MLLPLLTITLAAALATWLIRQPAAIRADDAPSPPTPPRLTKGHAVVLNRPGRFQVIVAVDATAWTLRTRAQDDPRTDALGDPGLDRNVLIEGDADAALADLDADHRRILRRCVANETWLGAETLEVTNPFDPDDSGLIPDMEQLSRTFRTGTAPLEERLAARATHDSVDAVREWAARRLLRRFKRVDLVEPLLSGLPDGGANLALDLAAARGDRAGLLAILLPAQPVARRYREQRTLALSLLAPQTLHDLGPRLAATVATDVDAELLSAIAFLAPRGVPPAVADAAMARLAAFSPDAADNAPLLPALVKLVADARRPADAATLAAWLEWLPEDEAVDAAQYMSVYAPPAAAGALRALAARARPANLRQAAKIAANAAADRAGDDAAGQLTVATADGALSVARGPGDLAAPAEPAPPRSRPGDPAGPTQRDP
jgi:hypothetical protein